MFISKERSAVLKARLLRIVGFYRWYHVKEHCRWAAENQTGKSEGMNLDAQKKEMSVNFIEYISLLQACHLGSLE